MNYISPVKIFSEEFSGNVADITQRDISIIKRKLLAEAELSDTKTVVRNNIEYSKEDIVKLFDGLTTDTQLSYHLRIFNDKPLLQFLENGKYDIYNEINVDQLVADEPYRLFVQPWFIPVWEKLLYANLRSRNFSAMCRLMHLANTIIDEYLLIELLEPLEGRLADFESKATEVTKLLLQNNTWKELNDYFNADLVAFLNLLPYTFASFRNSYMIVMINATVYMANKGYQASAIKYCEIAAELDCDDYYMSQLTERLINYRKKESSSSTWGGRGWGFAFFIIITVIRIAATDGCNSSSSNYAYSPVIPSNYYNSSTNSNSDNNYNDTYFYCDNIDSCRIAYKINGVANANFFFSLFNTLKINSTNSLPVIYPGNANVNSGTNQLNSFAKLIDKNWNAEAELKYAPALTTSVGIVNSTNAKLLLLCTNGRKMETYIVPALGGIHIIFEGKQNIIAPFFGTEWNVDKIIYENIRTKDEKKIATGWFENKIAGSNGISGSTLVLKNTSGINENNTNLITFLYSADKGFYQQVLNGNIALQ